MRVFTDLQHLPAFQNAVLTIGSFDGVHTGHQYILQQLQMLARQHSGEQVVITFDPHPRTVLRPGDADFRLISTTQEKIERLQAAGVDDVVIVPFNLAFAQLSAREYVEQFLLGRFHPACIVIGYDHRFGHSREGGIDFLRAYEQQGFFQLVEIPAQTVDEIAVSSSKIRKALERSDLQLANKLLGYAFTLSGQVVKGNQIGRTIGFPTANIRVEDPHKLILPEGIYAARTAIEEGRFDAMLYIGKRPSVETTRETVIEVNLLDFTGNLYGRYMSVQVLDFIRGDEKFADLAALQAQIAQDKLKIQEKLKRI
ncbi:MAG: riboflavin biosynthesis protein RibF [Bacteroidetes bacterium]|nr:riboflavin biosynthesis protein RibF [Bacteroidota bacterium]